MRPVAASLLAGLALSAQTQPTFYAAYEDGLEAVRQRDWPQAAGAFQRALRLRPEPAARILIYGNNLLKDYYPASHLARCQVELGEWEAAARTLKLAESRGEPASLWEPLTRRLPRGVETRPPAPAPVVPAPPKERPAAALPEPVAPPVGLLAPLADSRLAVAPAPSGVAAGDRPAPPVHPGLPVVPGLPVAPGPPPQAVPGVPLPTPQAVPDVPLPTPQAVPEPEAIPPWRPLHGVLAASLLIPLALLAWRSWRNSGRRPAPGPDPAGAGPAEPETIGRYRLIRVLGQGGFATTYLARHPDTGAEVALKVLHPHRLRDPEYLRSFAREARLGARLNHPHLVRLLDPGPPEGAAWIALEYVPGPTLAERLRDRGPVPLAEALETVLCLARAIAYAHAHGVVHRDLKPANIILGPEGPKLMDLGIARELDGHTLTTTAAFLGTPMYAAPEVHLATAAGPAADRYSLGVILFELLTGAPPFRGATPFAVLDQHRSAAVPELPDALGLPASLVRLVRRLLDKDPERRPEDGELVAKLEGILAGLEEPSGAPDRIQ